MYTKHQDAFCQCVCCVCAMSEFMNIKKWCRVTSFVCFHYNRTTHAENVFRRHNRTTTHSTSVSNISNSFLYFTLLFVHILGRQNKCFHVEINMVCRARKAIHKYGFTVLSVTFLSMHICFHFLYKSTSVHGHNMHVC